MNKNPRKSRRKCEIQARINPNPNQIQPKSSQIKSNATKILVNESQIKPTPAKAKILNSNQIQKPNPSRPGIQALF